MNVFKLVVSWLFPISVVLYLFFLRSFISKVKSRQECYWKSIGNPSSFDPNGQMKVLSLIFLPRKIPKPIWDMQKKRVYAIRLFAFLSLASLALIVYMIEIGLYK